MVSIRTATAADVVAIQRVVAEAYSPYIARIGKPPSPMLDDYSRRVADGDVSVAADDEGIAGLVVVVMEDHQALLENVAVADRVRGLGIGRKLIDHAEALARDAGYPIIKLYTHVKMTENLAIYQNLGYRETHRVSESGFDRVYFAKDLD